MGGLGLLLIFVLSILKGEGWVGVIIDFRPFNIERRGVGWGYY